MESRSSLGLAEKFAFLNLLFVAISNYNLSLVIETQIKSLELENINLQHPDYNLNTALHWAVIYNNIEAVNLLCKYNANPHIMNTHGLSPLQTAITMQHKNIISILEEYVKNTAEAGTNLERENEILPQLRNNKAQKVLASSQQTLSEIAKKAIEILKPFDSYTQKELNLSELLTKLHNHNLLTFTEDSVLIPVPVNIRDVSNIRGIINATLRHKLVEKKRFSDIYPWKSTPEGYEITFIDSAKTKEEHWNTLVTIFNKGFKIISIQPKEPKPKTAAKTNILMSPISAQPSEENSSLTTTFSLFPPSPEMKRDEQVEEQSPRKKQKKAIYLG